jgi:hypothetical protein
LVLPTLILCPQNWQLAPILHKSRILTIRISTYFAVSCIGQGAFRYSSLNSVTIPDTVTSISGYAFLGSDISEIIIGTNVTTIGEEAFLDCINLTRIYFKGNAPSVGSEAFAYDFAAIGYYLPTTVGWMSFSGLSTEQWLPLVNSGITAESGQNCQFGFNISGNSNLVVVVQACTNLANPVWQAVQTNVLLNGTSYFSDLQWTNFPGRFYRIYSP